MIGDFEAADRRAAEYEAQQRAANGPVIIQGDDDSDEPSYTPEEFAEMQAGCRDVRERKRQAVADFVSLVKRSRNT